MTGLVLLSLWFSGAEPPGCELVVVPFALDSSAIRDRAHEALRHDAECIKKRGGGVRIEGHVGEAMTREYAMALGERRARAVKQWLVGAGISADWLKTVSYGREKPRCTAKTPACARKNSRVELRFAE